MSTARGANSLSAGRRAERPTRTQKHLVGVQAREQAGRAVRPEPIRGYRKIEGAVRAFDFDFRGKTVLDVGSSTGGFTAYALERGARKVIAVEKGSHQMKSPLRLDPRVELHEQTDVFSVGTRPEKEHTEVTIEAPDIILADVSFLSLTKVLKYAKLNLSRSDTEFLVMFKPQFEASPSQLKNGVVKNETIRREIIKRFERWLKANRFIVIKKHDNELRGKTGNLERFYWLRNSS